MIIYFSDPYLSLIICLYLCQRIIYINMLAKKVVKFERVKPHCI